MADYYPNDDEFSPEPPRPLPDAALIAELRRQNAGLIVETVDQAKYLLELRGEIEAHQATIRETQYQVAAQRLRTEGTKKTVLDILRDMKDSRIDTDYLIAIADALDIETDTTIQRKVTIEAVVEIEVGLFEDEVSDYDFEYKIFHKSDEVYIASSDIEVEPY